MARSSLIIASALSASFYFARPYHSWERGLNEHTNGLVREYFPKATNFHTVETGSGEAGASAIEQASAPMLGLPHAGGGIPSCTRGRGCLRVQCVHGLSRVVARKTHRPIVACSGDIMRAYTQGKSHARPSALAASKVKEREFLRPASSFFSGRAPPSLRRSSFSALPVLSSVSTQGHTTLSTVVALRTLIGGIKCIGTVVF